MQHQQCKREVQFAGSGVFTAVAPSCCQGSSRVPTVPSGTCGSSAAVLISAILDSGFLQFHWGGTTGASLPRREPMLSVWGVQGRGTLSFPS